jgi:predicted 3-demethylubiquinone-9 3-methyltransferase (glyoxalase superfamily)
MSKEITPCLWFDNNAEEAMNFYMSLFPHSKILNESRYPEGGPMPEGLLLVATFELNGRTFQVLNGGPIFTFNESISLSVDCEDQEEIDYYWNALTADGGEESQCGWLKDKYGLSWQIAPYSLAELYNGPNKTKAAAAMAAMMQMKKIEIKVIQDAYDNA